MSFLPPVQSQIAPPAGPPSLSATLPGAANPQPPGQPIFPASLQASAPLQATIPALPPWVDPALASPSFPARSGAVQPAAPPTSALVSGPISSPAPGPAIVTVPVTHAGPAPAPLPAPVVTSVASGVASAPYANSVKGPTASAGSPPAALAAPGPRSASVTPAPDEAALVAAVPPATGWMPGSVAAAAQSAITDQIGSIAGGPGLALDGKANTLLPSPLPGGGAAAQSSAGLDPGLGPNTGSQSAARPEGQGTPLVIYVPTGNTGPPTRLTNYAPGVDVILGQAPAPAPA